MFDVDDLACSGTAGKGVSTASEHWSYFMRSLWTLASLSRFRLTIVTVLALQAFTSLIAQERRPLPTPVVGPQPLPILPALPTRDDVSFYSVRDVPHGTVEQTTYQDPDGREKRCTSICHRDTATAKTRIRCCI